MKKQQLRQVLIEAWEGREMSDAEELEFNADVDYGTLSGRIAAFRRKCDRFVESTMVSSFIFFVIVVAGALVGLQTYKSAQRWSKDNGGVFEVTDTVILWIFTAEVVLKIIGKGGHFFRGG